MLSNMIRFHFISFQLFPSQYHSFHLILSYINPSQLNRKSNNRELCELHSTFQWFRKLKPRSWFFLLIVSFSTLSKLAQTIQNWQLWTWKVSCWLRLAIGITIGFDLSLTEVNLGTNECGFTTSRHFSVIIFKF